MGCSVQGAVIPGYDMQYLRLGLADEFVVEVPIAMKICAEGGEEFVIPVVGGVGALIAAEGGVCVGIKLGKN